MGGNEKVARAIEIENLKMRRCKEGFNCVMYLPSENSFVIRNYKKMTAREIAVKLNRSPESVKKKLNQLFKKGVLKKSKLWADMP